MTNRRNFLKTSILASPMLSQVVQTESAAPSSAQVKLGSPCVISAWDFGVAANHACWQILSKGGRALDGVEAGVRVPEADLKNHSVGRAGIQTATDM
jgi:N4-(beta-N-acetylglucosaminyl)-L-asparaginase